MWWLGVMLKQAINWANVNIDARNHIAMVLLRVKVHVSKLFQIYTFIV